MKKGQIAHLDRDPNNNDHDNLAFLCFDHHDEYDSKTRQSAGLTIGEVKKYRRQLYEYFDHGQEQALISAEPLAKKEKLVSNLLQLERFPASIYVASTEFRRPRDLWNHITADETNPTTGELFLKRGQIISFLDLSLPPWQNVCDLGTLEEFGSDEWSLADDPDRRRDFVQLLNRALEVSVAGELFHHRDKNYYYFLPLKNGRDRTYSYRSHSARTSRRVVKRYVRQKSKGTAYIRHSAFRGKWRRFHDIWHLEITPTYHFTRDGYREHRYAAERLMTIKQLELNAAVLGQVTMWAEYLRQRGSLFAKPLLEFGRLVTFDLDYGVDDTEWRGPQKDESNDEESEQLKLL